MGYRVTGYNGDSIFIPFSGYKDKAGVVGQNIVGYYWLNSFDVENNYSAAMLYCGYEPQLGEEYAEYYQATKEGVARYYGLPVRPVYAGG